jgi:electron-transferring-flavoprotein dehydrogenase
MTNEEILAQYGPREAMEYDVVVVGGGPAACPPPSASSSWPPKKARTSRSWCWKKAPSPARTRCPAPSWTQGADRADPRLEGKGAPLNQPVTEDAMVFLSEKGSLRTPNWLLPQCFHNEGNYIVSLGFVTKWLAEQAEALGVEIFPALPRPKCCTTKTAPSRAWPPATWASARMASPPRTSSWAWSCTASTPSSPKAHAATWASN